MDTHRTATATAKIVPHLWFDDNAVEAARFYATLFPDSHVDTVTALPADSPSGPAGSVDIVEFALFGQPFMAINAGPEFRFNPSISFMVNFDPLFFGSSATRNEDAKRRLDEVWEKLSAGGQALMPIGEYPFSERYGWIQDKYGLSWQLILTNPDNDPRPPILPAMLFTGKNYGKAEEAIKFYLSVFRGSRMGTLVRYGPGQPGEKEDAVAFADFMLENQWFVANESAQDHNFEFNEAVSLMVHCEDQREIDEYWKKLSAVPEAEACGWVKDRYGVSWQIVPTVLGEMMKDPDRDRARHAAEAMLKMKKLDIGELERAYGK
jgi:predicted 3-demethylubiquinone-9 3-methyltransferase (glyoxalase superfamily)